MANANLVDTRNNFLQDVLNWGVFWLVIAFVSAGFFFNEGIAELLKAWKLPEYSHGPLIPVLSGLLFLRQLKTVPVNYGPVADRWPGVVLLLVAVLIGAGGKIIEIRDIVAYGLILWVGAILLISFGWKTGKHFWPPVVHLVFMLPLPGAVYYGLSTFLQGISSELGVYFLQLISVPVYLEGNIIDLGVFKLQVAEACSGLRYLFPILSFSYIFAVLYQGPMWHKALLLVSAAPITVFMNSVRIAIAGWIVNNYGLDHVEGFSHFFEGWVIFISCVLILFAFAWVLVKLRRDRIGLIEALDLDTEGLATQARRITLVRPSAAMIFAAVFVGALAVSWQAMPTRGEVQIDREPFVLFPKRLEEWRIGPHQPLDPEIEQVLGADDYLSVNMSQAVEPLPVELFVAWYRDQTDGGTHSPEVCLPSAGWEIAELEQIDATSRTGETFSLNRAIIQKGVTRMLVYYWYDQRGVRTASEYEAKLHLMLGRFLDGRDDSAIVRLTTLVDPQEGLGAAEERLQKAMDAAMQTLPRFVPEP
ncbi:VPLPA-CTERM-specific exosortase XrtD [Roseovarius aestuariivivens]|uniref:VPLPA-CTERM-specific exosortase XrtD n=1 Tax=Roseovarius aestuariivivens TaxID=1888910 RepID=UPI00108019D8|nr:VPLPA-CTERM-specific exosortase XrtD [Roseovarius aestuariivivens]